MRHAEADGRVVYEPTDVHRCVVTFRYGDNGNGLVGFDHPAHYAEPGTVLACGCGRTFVAQERRPGEMFPRWRLEGRLARWRRKHRQRERP